MVGLILEGDLVTVVNTSVCFQLTCCM